MQTRRERADRTGGGLPAWLDSRTVALIGTVVTVGLGIAAMIMATASATRTELSMRIENVRLELSTRIEDVRKELLAEIKVIEGRLRVVELDVAATRTKVELVSPSPSPHPSEEAGAAPQDRIYRP